MKKMNIIGFIFVVALTLGLSFQQAEAHAVSGGGGIGGHTHKKGCDVITQADAAALAYAQAYLESGATVASNTFVGDSAYPADVLVEIDFKLLEGAKGQECTFDIPMYYYDSSGNEITDPTSNNVASCTAGGGAYNFGVCGDDID
jgi:hypothetical protein